MTSCRTGRHHGALSEGVPVRIVAKSVPGASMMAGRSAVTINGGGVFVAPSRTPSHDQDDENCEEARGEGQFHIIEMTRRTTC